jgi:hypothetical protein
MARSTVAVFVQYFFVPADLLHSSTKGRLALILKRVT